ncbi:hypothetical protein ACJJTC_001250 [Scirpophaga incertulas]
MLRNRLLSYATLGRAVIFAVFLRNSRTLRVKVADVWQFSHFEEKQNLDLGIKDRFVMPPVLDALQFNVAAFYNTVNKYGDWCVQHSHVELARTLLAPPHGLRNTAVNPGRRFPRSFFNYSVLLCR